MKRVVRRSFLLPIVLLGFALPAISQNKNPQNQPWRGKAEVAGKVVDDFGSPLEDVRVTWVHVASNTGFFVTTKKKSGEFSAKDITPGEWRVQIDAPDFVTLRQTVQVAEKKNAPLSLQIKRDNSPVLLAKGDSLFQAGKFAEARAEYEQVLKNHPEFTAINRAIAFTYGRAGNHAEALKYLDLALAGNPNDAQLLELSAASAIELGDYPRAMTYLGKIDDATLPDPDVMSNAAAALLKKGQIADGVKVLDRMIARFPQAPEPYFFRAVARLQGDKVAAKADLEKFVSLAPPDSPMLPQAKEWLGQLK